MKRPHRHDYKKCQQHLGIPQAQPVFMPWINQGDLLQVPGQASAIVGYPTVHDFALLRYVRWAIWLGKSRNDE